MNVDGCLCIEECCRRRILCLLVSDEHSYLYSIAVDDTEEMHDIDIDSSYTMKEH